MSVTKQQYLANVWTGVKQGRELFPEQHTGNTRWQFSFEKSDF